MSDSAPILISYRIYRILVLNNIGAIGMQNVMQQIENNNLLFVCFHTQIFSVHRTWFMRMAFLIC